MSRILRLVIALALTAPALVSMAGPAVACSCLPQSAHKVIAQADAVVAGHVIGEQPIDPMTTHSTLAVDGIYSGKVDATVVLSANLGSGGANSCAVLYPVGSKVDPLVLQRLDDGTYQVEVCALLSHAELVRVLGTARPPPRASASPSPAAAATPPAADRRGLSPAAVLGGLLLAMGAIVLLRRWSGRRRERHQPTPIEEMQRSARRAARG